MRSVAMFVALVSATPMPSTQQAENVGPPS
jgi:hypothetical protein